MKNLKRVVASLNSSLTVGSLTLLTLGCAVTGIVEENAATTELAPMERLVLTENRRIYEMNRLSGKEEYLEITELHEDGAISGENSDGCSWKNFGDMISPALSWNNCGDDPQWHSGENRDMEKDGEIWPLKVGNKVSYSYTQFNADGENTGRKIRECVVKNVVNIEVNAEQHDAYKVVCTRSQEGWSQTTTVYFSPDKNWNLKFVQADSSDGIRYNKDLLRVEQL